MEKNIFGNFQESSTFIDSLSKVNDYLNYYFEKSKFPNEDLELNSMLTQVLPILTKFSTINIQEKKITSDQFFQQIKILFGFYVKLIETDNIQVSSLLLQILISIYIYFPNFLKRDIYNISDILTLNTITNFFQLLTPNSDYIDIFILVLLLILIHNENIGSIEDQEFIFKYITMFNQSIDTFNYDKIDPAFFIQIFWLFDQITFTFPTFSENSTNDTNFFNSFMNFSIKSLQSCQSIEKQKASIRFINLSLQNERYKIEEKSDKTAADNNEQALNDAIYGYKQNSDSNDINSKSDSLDIVHNFDIEDENVLKNPLFVRWAQKFNPLSSLINVDGHLDTLQEVDILIQKICKIFEGTNATIDQITSEILCQIANRVESADDSQKKIFIHEFASIFSFLCEASDQLAIEFLQKVNQEANEEEASDTFSNVVVSNSTLLELGKELITNKTVFTNIVTMFETQIYDHNESGSIPFAIQLIKLSKKQVIVELDRCLNVLKTENEPPQIIYEMLTSIVAILNKNDVYKLFSELILLSEAVKNENFRSLLEEVTIKCRTQLNKQESTLLIQEFCVDDDGWRAMLNIYNHRKVSIFKRSGWIFLIEILCQSKMTAMSLNFLKAFFPDLLSVMKYDEKNYDLYNAIFIHLMDDYVQFENIQSFETFIQIETYLYSTDKQCMYKTLISVKLAEMSKVDHLDRLFDFFRMIIEKKEWNLNFSSFEKINYFGIKQFKRLKELKKPPDSFFIHVSVQPPNSDKAENHYIEVCPDTTIADIIIYLGVGIGIESNLSIHSLDESYYCYYENMRTDEMYYELPDYDTIKDLGITEETDLRMFYHHGGSSSYEYINFFPSEILSQSDLPKFLVEIINKNEDTKLIKSAWKLYCLLKPEYNLSISMLHSAKTLYSKLYYLKILAYHFNENPATLKNPAIISNLSIIVNMIISEKMDGKLLNAALATLTFKEASISISNGGVQLLEILIHSFIESTSNTLCERILTVMNFAQNTKRINEFDSVVINNANFLKKCITLNSSETFKKKEIIDKFFDSFELNSKKVLFDFFSKSFMETNENCFSILKVTLTDDCEVTDLFEKSIQTFVELKDDNEQYSRHLALFIDFMLAKRKDLIEKTADISTQLVTKALNEMDNERQLYIFRVLLHYIIETQFSQNAINELIKIFSTFESARWNYDPSILKKKLHFCGLRSLGMTCYMNSILQQLAYNKLFRNSLFKLDNSNSNSIALELQKIVANLELSNRSVVNTEKFSLEWKQKGFPRFDPRIQEDVVEFFHCLLDHLPSDLGNIFAGEQVNVFEGINVPFTKAVTEPFSSIEIPVSATFSDAMKSLSSKTLFVGNNQYNSEEFGKIDVIMKTKIVKFPNTFVIQLKRFEFSLKTGVRTKISRSFTFPSKFNTNEFFEDENQSNIEYVLKGVVTHAGTAEGGHYNSIINIDNSWVLFNDNEVQILTESQFSSLTKGGSKKNSLQSCAYVLFYVACDPEKHQMLRKSISCYNEDSVNDGNDENVPVPRSLVEEITKENEAFKKMQCIFTPCLAAFVLETQNIDIILPYFLNVFSHSIMIKTTSSVTQKIKGFLGNNKEKGFDFFFSNENIIKTVDILLNGQDDLVQPFIFLLCHFIQSKCKTYDSNQRENELKLTNDLNLIKLILEKAKENAGSWKNLERFGSLINSFVDNYKNLINDEQTKTNICLQMIDIVTKFYEITNSEFSLKQVDFSDYFKSLVTLNKSIENTEVFDSFINKVKGKLITNSGQNNSFTKLVETVSNRKKASTGNSIENYEKEKEKQEDNCEDDDLGPFDVTEIKKNLKKVIQRNADMLRKFIISINTETNVIAILDSIRDDDTDSLISFLSSKNFNFADIYNYFMYPKYFQEKNYFCQIIYRKPLILSRMFIIPEFFPMTVQMYSYVFPYISFVNEAPAQVAVTDPSMILRAYNYIIDSFKLYIKMKDFPWIYSEITQVYFKLTFIYQSIVSFLKPSQIENVFNLNERLFLTFTSYVDIHGDDQILTNDPFVLTARERRKSLNKNAMLAFFFNDVFDTKFLIPTFEKYSKYYIRYCTFIPLKDEEDFDFSIVVVFRKAFNLRPDLFLRLLKSDEIIYPLSSSPKSGLLIKQIAASARSKDVLDYVLFGLMEKVPLTVVLNGTFMKLAVDNAELLAEKSEEAKKLISRFVEEFFTNVDQIVKKNRVFSSMSDISKIVQVVGSKSDKNCEVFVFSEKAKKGFVKNFLNVINQSNFNDDASKFVTSLSSQNENFANFLLTTLNLILTSQNEESLKICDVTVKSDVLSSINCWKLISMNIEFSKDIENSIMPFVNLLLNSNFASEEEIDAQLNEYYQIFIEKVASFVNDLNVAQFRPLFDIILSSSIQISDHILPFLVQVIKQLDEDEKSSLILGTFVFMIDPEDKERFIHAFKVVVTLLRNMKDPRPVLNELNETFPEIMELQDSWPEECNNEKCFFQLN